MSIEIRGLYNYMCICIGRNLPEATRYSIRIVHNNERSTHAQNYFLPTNELRSQEFLLPG